MEKRTATAQRSAPQNILDALKLSREASRPLFLLVMTLPALEGVLTVVLLLFVRGGAGALLEAQIPASDLLRRVAPWLAAVVVVTLLSLVIDNVRHLAQELLLDRVRVLGGRRMHRAIALLQLIEFDDTDVHDRISRAEATADTKPRQVVRGVSALVVAAFNILAITVLLIVLEPLMLPLIALAAVPIVALSSRMAGQRFRFFYGITALERRRRYLGSLLTGRQAAAEVRMFGLNDHFEQRYDELSEERYDELRSMTRKQWHGMLAGQLTFALVLLCGIGVLAWLFGSGRMDTATLVTAVIALNRLGSAVGSLGGPLTELGEAALFLEDQGAFYRRIAAANDESDAGSAPGGLRQLQVVHLDFQYPGAEKPALKDIDLSIEKGQIVAFVGPNGSGKTTLAKVLAFLYEPSSGTVLWNGEDAATIDRRALRDQVTAVFQDHMTYHLSVADNIWLGDVSADKNVDDLRAAARAGGVDAFVDALPDGLQTMLGPEFVEGTSLSGGELQRLAIARAFFRSRDLVILDEPTSALDAQADHALLRDLRNLLRGRTAVVISHRFSNVRTADLIVVFRDGQIVERGTHEELMARDGLYAEMYALQAGVYLDDSAMERR